jgi:hypothetical protein
MKGREHADDGTGQDDAPKPGDDDLRKGPEPCSDTGHNPEPEIDAEATVRVRGLPQEKGTDGGGPSERDRETQEGQ